jgi:beta-N-acetylhexosaminidase
MATRTPLAAIFGCAGPVLTHTEQGFFRDADPLGFILFHRNIADPAQVESLVGQLRDSVGRQAPVLIDQEGGRVQRLRPPLWRQAPAAATLGALFARAPSAATRATWVNARLIAAELAQLGIDVDCAPVLDVPTTDADQVIGDRAFGTDPETVVALGRAMVDGLTEGGVLPVIKHLPGHGRATLDSHVALPVVTADRSALEADLAPFCALAGVPFAMTAHVTYSSWDADAPATLSAHVIEQIIRGAIGFDGALLSDDIGMEALEGSLAVRARKAQMAGCDLILHCSGNFEQMASIAQVLAPLAGAAAARVDRALAARREPQAADVTALRAELDALIGSDPAA